MTTISRFYGILIRLYYDEHHHELPHVHVEYAEYMVVLSLEDLSILGGYVPANVLRMTRAWAREHQEELLSGWEDVKAGRAPSKIPPLKTRRKKKRPARDPARRAHAKPYPKIRFFEVLNDGRVRVFFGVNRKLAVKEVDLRKGWDVLERLEQEGGTGLSAGFPNEWSATELFRMKGFWLQKSDRKVVSF